MADDPLIRVYEKLDLIRTSIEGIRVEAATDRAQLAAHLLECTNRNAAIHKRIDDMKSTQRWWSGKMIGAALTGGGFAEVTRFLFGRGAE